MIFWYTGFMVPGIDYIGVSVCFYCHDGQNNFLLQKRSQKTRDQQGRWDCGGGKLEFGESIEAGLKRELKEEYGCDGEIEEILPPVSFFEEVNGIGKHWIGLLHIVRVNRDEVKNCEPQSIDELGWFRLDQLPSPLHTNVVNEMKIYKKYFERYLPPTFSR